MDVETLAVSTISNMIARCPCLKPFITANDRTPFTDGHIDLYRRIGQRKADWVGRVPVQVKGRTVPSSRKKRLSKYLIPRTELLAFQRDSGVLYFVVEVNPSGETLTPYYALLSPFSIQAIMQKGGDTQKNVAVPLKEMPTECSSIESLVALALKTRDQKVAQGFDATLFEQVERFSLHTASELATDSPFTLTAGANDFALVLHTKGGLSVPLSGDIAIVPGEYIASYRELQIASGPVSYSGATVKRIDRESVQAVLSEGVSIVFRFESGGASTTINLTLDGVLPDRLKALDFFLALCETGRLELNGGNVVVDGVPRTPDAWLLQHAHELRSLSELMEDLGVDPTLVDLSDVDEKQVRQLLTLHGAFVKHEEVVNVDLRPSLVSQRVGRWELMVLVMNGSAPGAWRLVDPFSSEVRQQFYSISADDATSVVPVTPYDVIEAGRLVNVLNLRLGSIVGAYEAIADFSNTFTLANHQVLRLIAAADADGARRGEFLYAAALLNDWLMVQGSEELDHSINRWQILWRQDGLSSDDLREIRRLKRRMVAGDGERDRLLELACALLLEDDGEVNELLTLLPSDTRRILESWPIWKLYGGQRP